MARGLEVLGVLLLGTLAAAGCAQPGTAPAAGPRERSYELVFTIDLTAAAGERNAGIRVGRGANRLREIRFDFDPSRFSRFDADGELEIDGNGLVWNPPRDGGGLRYRAAIAHQRSDGAYDARVTADWALFRGNDVFPAAATRALVGSTSESRLEFTLPKGWSVLTRYLTGDNDYSFPVTNPERNFDRPTGWILAGRIGVRRSNIADTRVAIGAPVGEDFRRMDIMAFLNWTLPGIVDVFPSMDDRLVIVGAGDPMWRGGLSGPGSLYVHADRPLISENGTSTFLHELVHVAMGVAGSEHDDWIVEGLAEYYSIRILARSGTLSERRMELALEQLRDWGAGVDDLFVGSAAAEVMARAATLLAELDAELLRGAGDTGGLDAVVRRLIRDDSPYDYRSLCRAARAVAGRLPRVLTPAEVPGAAGVPECEPD